MMPAQLCKTLAEPIPWMQPWVLPKTAWGLFPTPRGLERLAGSICPISLKEMDAVALMDRLDTKYVMSTDQLLRALAAVKDEYQILTVDGQRMHHYRTLYFDTPDFALYQLHVNERAERYKVRSREYLESDLSFLEVKHRNRKDRTIKDRISTALPLVHLNPNAESWLQSVLPYDAHQLEAKLWNTFTRITLVNTHRCERVTLDVDLTFYTSHQVVQMEGLAIAEVKVDSSGQSSPFQAQMRAQRIHPSGFSKYCVGTALLYEGVKKNILKAKMKQLEKIRQGAIS
jgi:hypothetical protein